MSLYDYANGDPINYFDPDGRFFKKLFKKVGNFFKKAAKVVKKVVKKVGKFVKKYWKPILTIAVAVVVTIYAPQFSSIAWKQAMAVGGLAGAASGATSAALNGGSVKDVLKGAVVGGLRGAVSAGITYGVASGIEGVSNFELHNAFADGYDTLTHAVKVASNGVSGGITSEIFGGDFVDGMVGGAVSAGISPLTAHMTELGGGYEMGAYGVAALGGGLGAVATGGDFEMGAVSGLFTFAFNQNGKVRRNRKVNSGSFLETASTAIDFIPIAGNVKSGIETLFGYNPITFNRLSASERSLSAIGVIGGGYTKGGSKLYKAYQGASNAIPASTRLVGAGDRLGDAAKWVKPIEGTFDVVVHGSENAFHVLHKNQWVEINHRSLATFVKKQGYTGGDVRLISCSSGACSNGVAQNLSNKLGADVAAPSNTIWIHPNGKLTIGDSATQNTGVWNIFTAGGN